MIRQKIQKIFICLLIINIVVVYTAYADDVDDVTEKTPLEEIETETRKIVEEVDGSLHNQENSREVATALDKIPTINSRKWVIYDRKSKRVLEGKNEAVICAMASTTKIMTATIVLESVDLNKQVIISNKAANTGGSRLGLRKGDKITIRDLLYGLMLRSGNDAAIALAEEVGGSISEFAEMMNQKAKSLSLMNTHFVTPHGLDHPEHYTTASDLARLTDYALCNDLFRKIVGTKTHMITKNGSSMVIHNTNELLGVLNRRCGSENRIYQRCR